MPENRPKTPGLYRANPEWCSHRNLKHTAIPIGTLDPARPVTLADVTKPMWRKHTLCLDCGTCWE